MFWRKQPVQPDHANRHRAGGAYASQGADERTEQKVRVESSPGAPICLSRVITWFRIYNGFVERNTLFLWTCGG